MTIQTETRRAGEHILSEAAGYRSREAITIDESQTLVAGQILGKITEGAKVAAGAAGVPAPAAATITAVPTAALNTKVGVHRFQCISGGAAGASKWAHTDPDGVFVGIATGDAAYTGGGLSGLTIADAGTDPVAGEAFAVTVTEPAAASGRYVMHDPEGINGSQTVAGVLFDAVTTGASETAKAVAHVRDCEVKTDLLAYDDHTTDEKTAARLGLTALGIICRA